jgi:hypothetical protein
MVFRFAMYELQDPGTDLGDGHDYFIHAPIIRALSIPPK